MTGDDVDMQGDCNVLFTKYVTAHADNVIEAGSRH